MASPNTSYSEIVTTTLRHRSGELADNVSNSNALLSRLAMKGNVRTVSGGRVIAEELAYAENATFKYYSGYEVLDISPSDVFSAAEFPWKQAAVVVSASGLEVDIQNAGKEAVIDLLEKRIQNAFKTMRNQISSGIYSDGTGSGSKQITGLQALVADDPTTGTVGGIDRSVWSFWQNQYLTNSTMTAAVIQGYMQTLWVQCIRGADKPDLITADAYCYGYYWDALQAIQRITATDVGQQGWNSLKFLNADVIYDGDSGHPAYGMYFLNTDYLYFRPHVNRNFVPLERRESVNQDAFVVPIVFAGNLTMSNASLQGVLLKTGRA
jgi:hypothetical protein